MGFMLFSGNKKEPLGFKGFRGCGGGFAAGCVEGLCSLRSRGDGPLGRGCWWRLRRSFIGRLSADSFEVCVIFNTYCFGDWPLTSVSRPKGRPFYGQAKGQLRLTWRSYAGPPQPPPIPLRGTSPYSGGRIKSLYAFLQRHTTQLFNIPSPTAKWGAKRWDYNPQDFTAH